MYLIDLVNYLTSRKPSALSCRSRYLENVGIDFAEGETKHGLRTGRLRRFASGTGMELGETDRFGSLMRAAQDGDNAAYLRLLTEITPVLRRVIGARRGSLQGPDVEDVVQEVLISIHSARATYDPARPFMPWMLAIARNRTFDAMQRRGRVAANELSGIEFPETFSGDSQNISGDTYGDPEALRQAMAQLTPGQRQAVEMLKLREMSLKEAVAASGMSVSALKTAAHRGMNALRKALGARTEP
jgi:RNA polymerase sigma-70 factor (ECF subfamily)